jgi:hypothetical protein
MTTRASTCRTDTTIASNDNGLLLVMTMAHDISFDTENLISLIIIQ